MLKEQQQDLSKGVVMLASFLVILVTLFLPVFRDTTPIHFMDELYNSISKGSVYYIGQLRTETDRLQGEQIRYEWQAMNPERATRVAGILKSAGIEALTDQSLVRADADLQKLLSVILEDADDMFHNRGEAVRNRYDVPAKTVMFEWWNTLKAVEKELNRQQRFAAAKQVHSVLTKGVECSYNYFGIEARHIGDQALLVIASLVFYVIYTIWLGYAILFLLKGFGLKLEHD